MNRIIVMFKDGTSREFNHRPRAGGSWTLSCRYENSFYVIVDEYGKETAFPLQDIKEIVAEPERGGW